MGKFIVLKTKRAMRSRRMTELERIADEALQLFRPVLVGLLLEQLKKPGVMEKISVETDMQAGTSLYAVGYLNKESTASVSSYGMCWGPTNDLGECMSFSPDKDQFGGKTAHLLKLGLNSNHEVVYNWNWDKEDWEAYGG